MSQPEVSQQASRPEKPKGGQYPSWFTKLWIELVVTGSVPLSGVQGVLEIIGNAIGLRFPSPHFTTGRNWLLRTGLAALNKPLENALDWIWIADHSIQIGTVKLLLVVGLQAAHMPPIGKALKLSDLHLITLIPMNGSNAASVHKELQHAAERTGCPRVIVSDHGADLLGGIRLWIADHPETLEIYDVAHKAACLLKSRLEGDPRWAMFVKLASSFKTQVTQTKLFRMMPPSLRTKARFMNVTPLIDWGYKMLAVLAGGDATKSIPTVPHQILREKLGWLEEFRSAIQEWREWLKVTDTVLKLIRTRGHSLQTPSILDHQLVRPFAFSTSEELASVFQQFVANQSGSLRVFERLAGSSEVLESLFGKFKTMERQQAKGGFTSLILAIGNLVGRATHTITTTVTKALESTGIKKVAKWLKHHLRTAAPSPIPTLAPVN